MPCISKIATNRDYCQIRRTARCYNVRARCVQTKRSEREWLWLASLLKKHTLPNGLDVILHQDRSIPVAAVNVWYHVGSKDEEIGRTGFAHLFEHIMFRGTRHHKASHFEPLQKIGATLNGSTTGDRTNYWEDVPSNYLKLALWLEADRMGFLLDALDQDGFDTERRRG